MTAYYNEIDPFAAAWLRELIREGLIAKGEVDERNIKDVIPCELNGFTQCHFFAGIGVWSYALRLAGWPDDRPVWTGSCPCQPFSAAGKGAGFDDERHLWPDFFHLIRHGKPRPVPVFGEQVGSPVGLAWLDLVQTDMENEAHACWAVDTCAAGFGAPHIRQRLYWMAHSDQQQQHRRRDARPGRRGEFADIGAASELADPASAGSFPGPFAGIHSGEESPRPRDAEPERSGTAGQLGDAESVTRRLSGEFTGQEASQPSRSNETHRVADADDTGPQGRLGGWNGAGKQLAGSRGMEREELPRPVNGFWRDADWLFCRDAKWRPVEPGAFPLADGIAGRVGHLRGYGNAVNAWQAAAFIDACKGAMKL